MRLLLLTLLLLTPSLAHAGTDSDEDSRGHMRPFRINGYEVSGAEYLPFQGTEPFRYPADVLWGFHPAGVRDQAINCAWISYLELKVLFRLNPSVLQKAVAQSPTHRFYIWVNDYGQASYDRPLRPHGLRRGSSYWTFESTLAQDGTCLTPQSDQVVNVLRNRQGSAH